ncbi:MAG: hypothetical protein GC203_05620 [Phenylobacterium sp.]|uniref:hypothetical protein n=1 Tax=Phenylobacterium sp. TaxID=1871053 RepID=UPI0025FE40D5|nr:hypothetical protein [Phenylobacterium sp.]MBI1197321.1 hypothetical protein [Phenylobacterium sp.]
MTWLAFAAFSAFAICCVAQFWLVERVASMLKARHPAIHRRVYGWRMGQRLYWFALFRRDRSLGDPELSCRTKDLQRLALLALGALAAFVVFASRAGL